MHIIKAYFERENCVNLVMNFVDGHYAIVANESSAADIVADVFVAVLLAVVVLVWLVAALVVLLFDRLQLGFDSVGLIRP